MRGTNYGTHTHAKKLNETYNDLWEALVPPIFFENSKIKIINDNVISTKEVAEKRALSK